MNLKPADGLCRKWTYDLHNSSVLNEAMTEYEAKFSAKGQPIFHCVATRPQEVIAHVVEKDECRNEARRSNLLWMLASISLLIVIGLENILSSTFVLDEGSSLSGYLVKQLFFLGAGIAAAWFIWRWGYQFIRRWCSKIVLINVLCLIAVKFVGITVNGARRWLGFGAFSFQPSEFAKLAAIITMAATIAFYLERHGN